MLDKIIYIIRDPRDVALSKADFAFTPYMQKHYPTWHESPSEYLEEKAEEIAHQWKDHVEEYLRQAPSHDILILFYERLQQDFEEELLLLLDYLGFSFSEDQRSRIAQKVSTGRMREQSPQHVRKASHYKWTDNMSGELIAQINTITGELLDKLNYPLGSKSAEGKLPRWRRRQNMVL